jgi:opacity protein-like surface antigen
VKKTLIALAALALFAATPALAAKGDKWLGLNFGGAVPTGDFSDAAKTGFEGGVTGTYMVANQVGVGVDVAYHMWSAKDDFNTFLQSEDNLAGATNSSAEAKFHALQATAHVMYMFPVQNSKAMPYLKGGLGIYSLGTKFDNAQVLGDPDSENKFGFNVGAGVNFNVSPMYNIGVGGAYHSIQTSGSATNLFTVGINLLWGMSGAQ